MAHDSPTAKSQASLGYGAHFQIESDDSPGVFEDIAEVTNITPPSFETDQVEVTHMQSPGRTREYIPGLITPGEMSFEMNYVPGSNSDVRLIAIRDETQASNRTKTCRLIYPNGVTDTFSANLRTYEFTMSFDDKMTATVTWQVTSTISRASLNSPA